MYNNVIQNIADCLHYQEIGPKQIRVDGLTTIIIYPQLLGLERLLETNPSSPEINYVLLQYYNKVGIKINSTTIEERCKDLDRYTKLEIDKLLNEDLE